MKKRKARSKPKAGYRFGYPTWQEIDRLKRIIRMVAEHPLGMPKKLWKKVLDEAGR